MADRRVFDQDDRGFLFFRTRADDVILSSGYRIDAVEVEAALLRHPVVVRECIVARVPDAERGEDVAALVVLDAGVEPDETVADELRSHVRAVTAPYKYPGSCAR